MSTIISFLESLRNINVTFVTPKKFEGVTIYDYQNLPFSFLIEKQRNDINCLMVTYNESSDAIISHKEPDKVLKLLGRSRKHTKDLFLKEVERLIDLYACNNSFRDDVVDRSIISLLRDHIAKCDVDTYLNEYFSLVQIACLKTTQLKF